MMRLFLLLNCFTVGQSVGGRLGFPDYKSAWTLMTAQSVNSSTFNFTHGLGELPGLVEVLVTPKDGDYKGFFFRATGNGGIDDDDYTPKYGGVVYLYDHIKVTVIVPKRNNHYLTGYALNTGYPTFIELNHGAENLPEMVIVRTRLTDGGNMGMYSDGQGTNRFVSGGNSRTHGGIVFGFNRYSVRIWISSTDGHSNFIYNTLDGWGLESYSTSGVLDVRVWCDMNLTVIVKESLNVGPAVENEQLTMPLSIKDYAISDVFVSILIQAQGGPNDGYFFQGIDSAMTEISESQSPCHYGGLIYSYSMERINFRRPNQTGGAIVCIGHINSNRMYTGPVENGIVSVKMWKLDLPLGHIILERYMLYQNNIGLDYPYIGAIRARSLKLCIFECSRTHACEAVKYNHAQYECTMFDFMFSDRVIDELGSDVWRLI